MQQGKNLNASDYQTFKKWIGLEDSSLEEDKKLLRDLELFMDIFFSESMTSAEVMMRFKYVLRKVKSGPLFSWCTWLLHRFISFLYVYYDETPRNLSLITGPSYGEINTILRDFFVDVYPDKFLDFNEYFQCSNDLCKNLDLTYAEMKRRLHLKMDDVLSLDHEIMLSLEVKLFKEWDDLLQKMKKDFSKKEKRYGLLMKRSNFKEKAFFLRDLGVLFSIAVILVAGLKFGNEWYEKNIEEKIQIYEPQFLFLDKFLGFKKDADEVSRGPASLVTHELIPEALSSDLDLSTTESPFTTESEVMITSWDLLPRDFDQADAEQSKYEEIKKGTFRDSMTGTKLAYRVLLKSSNVFKTREKVDELVERYQAEQADKVEPGIVVPGGAYYNLYVPRNYLKEFLAQLTNTKDATLYENHTRSENPPGKNKVFVWIKSY